VDLGASRENWVLTALTAMMGALLPGCSWPNADGPLPSGNCERQTLRVEHPRTRLRAFEHFGHLRRTGPLWVDESWRWRCKTL
jgi:hypothetical protein